MQHAKDAADELRSAKRGPATTRSALRQVRAGRTGKSTVLMALLATAATLAAEVGTAAPSLVIDASTGSVLHAEEPTRPWHPASTTKLMTAYVALKAIEGRRLTLDTPLIASANATRQRPSKIGIRPGQQITLDNALKILMVKSANDLAVVIAEGIAGSVDGFSALMNAEARRLGMVDSHFVNPHGFVGPGHQSSARDLALLARALYRDFPQYRDYWSIGAVQLGNRVFKNTNGLIGRYPGAMGMKTGFVCASGFNVVALAQQGGRTLITVVLGAASGAERTIKAAQLLDKGFSGNGTGASLASLGSGGYDAPPNMRQEICGRARSSVALSEDFQNDGAIYADAATFGGDNNNSAYSFFLPPQGPIGSTRVGVRSETGRIALGPRADLEPIPVFLGPAPGSTAVAVGPQAPASAVVSREPAPRANAFAATPALPAGRLLATGATPGGAAETPPSTGQAAASTGTTPAASAGIFGWSGTLTEAFSPAGVAPALADGAVGAPLALTSPASTARALAPLRPASAAGLRANAPAAGEPQRRLGAIEARAVSAGVNLDNAPPPPGVRGLPPLPTRPVVTAPKSKAVKVKAGASKAAPVARPATVTLAPVEQRRPVSSPTRSRE